MPLKPGEDAPPFTLPDQDGKPWSLSEHRGTPVVLYFYPKDDTPGCTTQACDIRDHWSDFGAVGGVVVGISPDDSASHASFAQKYELPHTLLADPDREAISAYGAWGERSRNGKTFQGVLRSSVVVDEEGKVLAVFDAIKPAEQSQRALAALKDR
ncbi:MAG: thioredoxin-dependent thiol peroxidase [Euzebyaceae bacterium]|jgi:peroxiredoxin Q/BCP|nr:thioredoxin-dependent thiol peroxidase [Euzebyaceae bacterium]